MPPPGSPLSRSNRPLDEAATSGTNSSTSSNTRGTFRGRWRRNGAGGMLKRPPATCFSLHATTNLRASAQDQRALSLTRNTADKTLHRDPCRSLFSEKRRQESHPLLQRARRPPTNTRHLNHVHRIKASHEQKKNMPQLIPPGRGTSILGPSPKKPSKTPPPPPQIPPPPLPAHPPPPPSRRRRSNHHLPRLPPPSHHRHLRKRFFSTS